jgi:AraC family transcriptional regulator
MKVFLTGATGYIGAVVAEKLQAAGHHIIGLTRTKTKAEALRKWDIEPFLGDLRNPDNLIPAAQQADGIIHTAFTHTHNFYQNLATSIQIERNFIATMKRTLAGSGKPFVATSNTGVLGDTGLIIASESYPTAKRSIISQHFKIEGDMLKAAKLDIRTVVLRLPIYIYGRARGTLFTEVQIKAACEMGIAYYIEPGNQLVSASHVDDVAQLHNRLPAWETVEHSYTEHLIDISEFTQVAKLERVFENKRQETPISTGEVAIIPAHTPHKLAWNQAGDCTFLILNPSIIARVAYESVDPDKVELVPHFDKPDPLIYQISSALKNILQTNPQGSSLYAESMATALAAHLLQHYSARKAVVQNFKGGIPKYKLQQAIDYINQNLAEDISLEAIAQQVGMSQYHFARLFKEATGFAPYQFVMKCRVERAKELILQKQLSIAEIALEVGFNSQSNFTQNFKRFTGVTPKQLRP